MHRELLPLLAVVVVGTGAASAQVDRAHFFETARTAEEAYALDARCASVLALKHRIAAPTRRDEADRELFMSWFQQDGAVAGKTDEEQFSDLTAALRVYRLEIKTNEAQLQRDVDLCASNLASRTRRN